MSVIELKKEKGKSFPLRIDTNLQLRIKSFKDRLKEMCDYDEVSPTHQHIIKYILNDLDEYDRNLLIAFYDYAECSPTKLAKLFAVDASNINSRIKKIQTKCKQSLT